jgi:hypothetical protein
MTSYVKAKELVCSHRELARFIGPRDPRLIGKAQKALGVTFPDSYRNFLEEFGSGNFGGIEFYGIVDENFTTSSIPNGVWYTLRIRSQYKFPQALVIVGTADDGSLCAIDSSRITETREAPVIRYEVGLSAKESYLGDVAADFGDFFLRGVLLALDWVRNEHNPQ